MRPYDLYAPLADAAGAGISYEAAKEAVLEVLKPLGAEYSAVLETAFGENWVDVYETPGKAAGAYILLNAINMRGPAVFLTPYSVRVSLVCLWHAARNPSLSGIKNPRYPAHIYGVKEYGSGADPHPYILLNHNGTADGVSTIAHELGHAVHQHLSNAAQPFDSAGVPTFTTEAASAVNEIILRKHMIDKAASDAERLFHTAGLAELYVTTFYMQAMYAEFEKEIHGAAEAGGTLSADALNGMWGGLLAKYFGESFEAPACASAGWSRIPHFYCNFYVYQYAASITAASQIASGILEHKPGAEEKYTQILRMGSRLGSIEALACAGADMSSPLVTEGLIKEFGALVDETERLLRAEGRAG